jgi:hypothetical protein
VIDPRVALEGVLGMLNRVRDAWRLVLDGARKLENPERVAHAKAKLLEIDREIRRIKNLLQA